MLPIPSRAEPTFFIINNILRAILETQVVLQKGQWLLDVGILVIVVGSGLECTFAQALDSLIFLLLEQGLLSDRV